MATSPELWSEAQRLVVMAGRTYREASALTGISESAIQKRAASDNWRAQRQRRLAFQDRMFALKEAALDRAEKAIAEGDKTAPQIVGVLARLEAARPERVLNDPGLRRAVAVEVLERLLVWLEATDGDLAAKLAEKLERFGRECLNE